MVEIDIKVLESFDIRLIDLIKKLEKENLGNDAAINEWQIPVIIRYGKFIIAQIKNTGEIVGVCECLREWKEKKIAFIHSFYVAKKFRSQGIGKQLLNSVIDILKKEEFESAELTVDIKNKPAVNFYMDFGFAARETRENEYGKGVNRNLMVLNLK